jgi:hypothetical protein
MAYSSNPNLLKARAIAMQLLVREHLPVQTVANRCGVHRSTIWHWKRKWDGLNVDVQLTNDNRQKTRPTFPVPFDSLPLPGVSQRCLHGLIAARELQASSWWRRSLLYAVSSNAVPR